jgi:flagellar basal-body rod modification protein FlgD
MIEATGKNDAGFIDKMRWANQPEDNAPHNQLTQKDFFALLTKQLSMQDPFKPMQNENMIAQMTSFASVDGINALKEEILNLNSVMTSSQALEASMLVGRKVLTESDAAFLSENDQVKGTVNVPEGVRANTVMVQDAAGQLIAHVPMPTGVTGNVEFIWDGMDSLGKPAAEGMYLFSCQADIDGQTEQLQIYTYGHVASVSLGGREQGTMLNILGREPVSLNEVVAVSEA